MARKERLTVTIDPDLLEAGQQAVASGRADSLSAWVSGALADRVAADRVVVVVREGGKGACAPLSRAAITRRFFVKARDCGPRRPRIGRSDLNRRLEALRAAIAQYEAEFGEITSEEIAAQALADSRA